MQKSPKYKSIDLNSIKDRQKYFKNLHEEVNKSRMAVVNLILYRKRLQVLKILSLALKKKLMKSKTSCKVQFQELILNQRKTYLFI